MNERRDPTAMPPDDRLAELAEALAIGYLRLLVSRKESQKELAEPPESEAPCAPLVNGAENAPGKESA